MSLFLLFSSLFAKICQLLSKQFLFSKTSSRSLQDVFSVTLFVFQDLFKTYLQYVFLKRLQGVFKTSSRRVCKTSCNYVFKTSTRRLRDVLEDKKMLHWRRLEDDFKTSLVRLRQDKSLLGRRLICSSRSSKLSQSEFLSKDADSFLEFFFFRMLFSHFYCSKSITWFLHQQII